MKKTSTIPPAIIQHFDSTLLSFPCPKFCDDSETLQHIYNWIVSKYINKLRKSESTRNKFLNLAYQFRELHERAQAKEKDILKQRQATKAKDPFILLNGLIEMASQYLKDLDKPNISFNHSTTVRFKRFGNDIKGE